MEDNLPGSDHPQLPISQAEAISAEQPLNNPPPPSSLSDQRGQSGGGQSALAPSNEEGSESIQLLMYEMQRLREDFDTKVKYDVSKERMIDSLHRELQSYREGMHFKILRPLFMDLISIHDDLGGLLEHILKENGVSRQMLRSLESFQESIEETLQRNGVEVFSTEGEVFVAGKQRALKVVDTDDPALDKQVARRLRKGFEYDGKVLRPEIVEVYRTISRTEQ